MPAHFEIKKRPDGWYYWTLHGENDEPLLTSPGFSNIGAAQNAVISARLSSLLDEWFKLGVTDDRKHYFILSALNTPVLGRSELYDSPQARDEAIKATKKVGPMAPLI